MEVVCDSEDVIPRLSLLRRIDTYIKNINDFIIVHDLITEPKEKEVTTTLRTWRVCAYISPRTRRLLSPGGGGLCSIGWGSARTTT